MQWLILRLVLNLYLKVNQSEGLAEVTSAIKRVPAACISATEFTSFMQVLILSQISLHCCETLLKVSRDLCKSVKDKTFTLLKSLLCL